MGRLLTDLPNPAFWGLVTAKQLVPGRMGRMGWRLLPEKVDIAEYVCAIGIYNNQAPESWELGARASVLLGIGLLPSSRTQVEVLRRRCTLNMATLIIPPKLLKPWTLRLDFPRWLDTVEIEVWEYSGSDLSVFDQLDRIEEKIDQL